MLEAAKFQAFVLINNCMEVMKRTVATSADLLRMQLVMFMRKTWVSCEHVPFMLLLIPYEITSGGSKSYIAYSGLIPPMFGPSSQSS